jgi:hypothetical protein
MVAVVSLTAAAAGLLPLAANGASEHATPRVPSAAQQMHRLEFEGYVASACTRKGTLMVNPTTHRRITVAVA